MKFNTLLVVLCVSIGSLVAVSEERPITKEACHELVDSLSTAITDCYIFPEKGAQIGAVLRENLNRGTYDDLSEPGQLAQRLTADILSVVSDTHFDVFYDPEFARQRRERAAATPESRHRSRAKDLSSEQMRNFGFLDARVLEGNVGYLLLEELSDYTEAITTAISALIYLANCDALILDLRHLGGGSASLIPIFAGCMSDPEQESELLNTLVSRDGVTRQTWTLPWLSGPSMFRTPVFVLISKSTFSGGEELAYTLKHHYHATLVGETTEGGAHSISIHLLGDGFVALIPDLRTVDAVTKTNWEGTGIEPDIPAPADNAIDVAWKEAIKRIAKPAADPGARQK